ncbi:MAG: sensor histidine kinase [Bacteroidia bacterium]
MIRTGLHTIMWLVYFALGVFYKSNSLPLDRALLHSLFTVGVSAVIFYTYAYWGIDRFFEKKRYSLFAAFSLILFVVAFVFRKMVEVPLFPDFFAFPGFEDGKRIPGYIFIITLLSMLISGIMRMFENRQARTRVMQELLKEQHVAQLQFLKAQINPHFLFNTLNNIYALAVTGSEKTADMVLLLSDLLRYVIYDGQDDAVSLQQEVKHIGKFIDLYQMKSEAPLNISFEKVGEIGAQKFAPMLLIPLVENCFKHSDIETNPDGFISLSLAVEGHVLIFKTSNSFNLHDGQKDAVGGVGLANIRQRLSMHYPGEHTLAIDASNNIFSTSLSLPISHA